MRLDAADKDYAIVGAMPVDAEGITYIYGRQSCDTRSAEGGDIDAGNAQFSGQEAMIDLRECVHSEGTRLHGRRVRIRATLVERFTCYHRRSYVCKTGVGDVLIGAAATIADYNGVERASHVKDKLVEMTHLNETIYGTGIAASHQGMEMKSGAYTLVPKFSDGQLEPSARIQCWFFAPEFGSPSVEIWKRAILSTKASAKIKTGRAKVQRVRQPETTQPTASA